MTTRKIEREIWIDAPTDTVWQAITEAEQLANWFAPSTSSRSGENGYIGLGWTVGSEPIKRFITHWQPSERLEFSWRDAPGGELELPVVITLAARDGGTLLTLVHSGFLSDASWDEEFESHGRGWSYELKSLKYYLETQRGRARSLVLERFPIDEMDALAGWHAVVGSQGVIRVLDDVAEGMEVLIELPTGAKSRAEIMFALKERDFVAILEKLHGGILRLALELGSGTPEIWVWAHSWQLSEADLKLMMAPVFETIREKLGAGG